MAIAYDPLLPEFYVYVFYVRGVPFYVGEGRSSRASDRVRFVRYLIDREDAGKPVKWVKSNRVIAEFLRRGEDVTVEYAYQGLTRGDALPRELEEINRLLAAGFRLANHQHNRGRDSSVEEIVEFVLSHGSVTEAVQPEPSRPSTVRETAAPLPILSSGKPQTHGLPESSVLDRPLYDAVVVATNKTTRTGDFFHLVQESAAKPIVLRDLIQKLVATYRPPSSMKDPKMVIRVRTKDAYTRLGYLRQA
jgi:hypothetical protein